MSGLEPIAIAALATTAAGTTASVVAGQRSAEEQREAQRIQQRQAEVANQRRIRQALAAARADRANLIASGVAQTGGFDSSSIAGGAAAADTQLASNISFARQTQGFNRAANQRLSRANTFAANADTFASLANLPTQFGFSPGDVIAAQDSVGTD
jgi:hypothetical protein